MPQTTYADGDPVLHPKLPSYESSLLIRTDFSNDVAWENICKLVQEPQTDDKFSARVECINEKAYERLEPAGIRSVLPSHSGHGFVFLVDTGAIARCDHPILVVDLQRDTPRTFRVVPTQAWAVENNLSLANIDFDEFMVACDQDGVFRGFPH